jgi:hypothetical protein
VKTFENICLIVITVCAAFLLLELGLLARDLRTDVTSTAQNVAAVLATVNQTAVQARDASEQAKLAAIEQRAYWQKTSLETYKTMASLRLTIVRTDRALNETLVPRLAASLDAATALQVSTMRNLTDTTTRIDETIDALRPAIDNAITATAAASADLADPAIHQTLAHLDETSARAALTAAQTEQIAGHLNDASRDFAAYVHRMTAPAHGVYNFLRQLLSLARDARQAGGI